MGDFTPKHRPKISKGRRLAVYVRDDWSCQYCGRKFEPTDGRYAPYETDPGPDVFGISVWLELDHVLPWSRGGDDSMENLRAACTPCNKRKLATTGQVDWAARIALALQELQDAEPSESAALSAAATLLGYQKSELPRPKASIELGA